MPIGDMLIHTNPVSPDEIREIQREIWNRIALLAHRENRKRDAPSQEDSDATSREGYDTWYHKKSSCEGRAGKSDDGSYDAPWKVEQKRAYDKETETSMKRPRLQGHICHH